MKLLQKSIKNYLYYSLIIFLLSIPVFYWLIQDLWITDVDESLIYQKEKIVEGLYSHNFDNNTVSKFSENAIQFDLGIYIYSCDTFHADADSIYDNNYYDATRKHIEPFRELRSYVNSAGNTYKIIIRKDLVESHDLIQGIAFTQIILYIFLLSGILLINSYFSKKTWKPFYQVIAELKKFKVDKEKPIEVVYSDIDEFKELNQSVKWLTENNINIYKSQKEFTENAAHETQTPIAIIKNQLDNLIQNKDISESQAKAINTIDRNINLLTKINRNLLLLSKIDNNQFPDTEEVDISDLLIETYETFKEQIELKKIEFKSDISTKIIINTNAYLWQLLVANLYMNAIKYNIPNGVIEISLQNNMLTISNTGKNSPLPAERIFDRFYKQNTQTEGSGLGLAIAKKICDTLGHKITYQHYTPNIHSFTISI